MPSCNPRFLGLLPLLVVVVAGCEPNRPSSVTFEVSLSEGASAEIAGLGLETPVHGRMYVLLANEGDEEPRSQTSLTGVPIWGMDVQDLRPGEPVRITLDDPNVIGYPFGDFSSVPDGSYQLQAFLNVYTSFPRSDGHVVSMHLNSGAGQSPFRAPGNAHSESVRVTVSGGIPSTTQLEITQTIPPRQPLSDGDVLQQGNPADSEHVRFVKIRSDVLSEFWGRDMYIGANVLLPAGYEDSDILYPTLYMQGHFPGESPPLGFREEGDQTGRTRARAAGFSEYWRSGQAPGFIVVSIRDANPFYDTSYGVNSANVGPYGDAIHEELIPYLEQEFRMIPERWARTLAGGSTGGWEAAALQVFYPDVYQGAWAWCPDSMDFNYYQIVNVYEDENAYFTTYDWMKVERPNARRPDGNVRSTVRMENHYERAVGPNSRSAGQWAIWEAVYGPTGDDGYPAPIWDPETGAINRDVASYWKENYDLTEIVRTQWTDLSDLLRGNLHVAVGDMDTYYLEQGVYLFEEMSNDLSGGQPFSFEYGRKKPHCWTGYSPSGSGEDLTNREFLRQVADHVRENVPAGSSYQSWYR